MADMMQMARTVVQLEAALQAMKRLYGAKWGEKSALYRTVLHAAIRWERCTVLQAAIPLAKHMSDAGENPVMLLAVAAEMCQEQTAKRARAEAQTAEADGGTQKGDT